MATTIKYKDLSGNMQTVDFDPSTQVEVTVYSDTLDYFIKTNSPSYSTTTEIIGGRPKRD